MIEPNPLNPHPIDDLGKSIWRVENGFPPQIALQSRHFSVPVGKTGQILTESLKSAAEKKVLVLVETRSTRL